tara:strand:+ start:2491 stop:2787 length:297 start_codon:yes stop_codon:yes gene_type:complete
MFDGETIERRDTIRLWSQLRAVKDLMLNNRDRWYSLEMIRSRLWYRYHLKASEASISARLRDLRKDNFGAFRVESRRLGNLYSYRVLPPLPKEQLEIL